MFDKSGLQIMRGVLGANPFNSGYRFADYLKVGGLLTLVTLVVLMAVLPIFWPLVP